MGRLLLVAVKRECTLTSTSNRYEVRRLGISNEEFHFYYFENRVQDCPACETSGGQGPMETAGQQIHMSDRNDDGEQKDSAIERNGREKTGTVLDPNGSDSGLANSCHERMGQNPSRVEAGPSRGYDRDGLVVNFSELKPYTSPRYPDKLGCHMVDVLKKLLDEGDAYVVEFGGVGDRLQDTLLVPARIIFLAMWISAIWHCVLEVLHPCNCTNRKLCMVIGVVIGSLYAPSCSWLVKVCPKFMSLPEGRKQKRQSEKKGVHTFPGLLRIFAFPALVLFCLMALVCGLHVFAGSENGEKFDGPGGKKNGLLNKLVPIFLGCSQAVLEILLRLLVQKLDIENETTIATIKTALVSTPLVFAAFITHDQRLPEVFRESVHDTAIIKYSVVWAKLAMNVLTNAIRILTVVPEKKRFSNLPWRVKLKISAPVYNRLELRSESLSTALLLGLCGVVENSFPDNLIFVFLFTMVASTLDRFSYNLHPEELYESPPKSQSRSNIVACLLFCHLSALLATYAILSVLLNANLLSFGGRWILPSWVTAVAYTANFLFIGCIYYLFRRAHEKLIPT